MGTLEALAANMIRLYGDEAANDLNRLLTALGSLDNEDQQRIAKVGLHVVATLLRKNSDYGSSVFKTPVLAPETTPAVGIRVRMSDKIERIQQLLAGDGGEVRAESVYDSFLDLAGYAILYVSRPETKADAYKAYPMVDFPKVGKAEEEEPPRIEKPDGTPFIPIFARTVDGKPLDEDGLRRLYEHINEQRTGGPDEDYEDEATNGTVELRHIFEEKERAKQADAFGPPEDVEGVSPERPDEAWRNDPIVDKAIQASDHESLPGVTKIAPRENERTVRRSR